MDRITGGRGLIVGRGADYVAFSPPLVATRSDVDEMCDILEESLAEVQEGLPRAG